MPVEILSDSDPQADAPNQRVTSDPTAGDDTVFVGVDEAGLGPMLGPLCVGCAVLRISPDSKLMQGFGQTQNPLDLAFANIWKALSPAVSAEPKDRLKSVVVCDSKLLHSPSRGIQPLEASVLPFISLLKPDILGSNSADSFWRDVTFAPKKARDLHPWYSNADLTIPLEASSDQISLRCSLLKQAMAKAKIQLLSLNSVSVIESEFNRMVEEHANKSDLNMAAFCFKLREVWQSHRSAVVVCDHLGGRQFYDEALLAYLQPDQIAVVEESQDVSTYGLQKSIQGRNHIMLISFMTKSDVKCFPVALASMVAKYSREVCMEMFNRYWCAQQPGLKPTKGYVTDARRWLKETAALRDAMEFPDHLLIRRL